MTDVSISTPDEELKKGERKIIDPRQFPISSADGLPEGDFIDFKKSTLKEIIDWLLTFWKFGADGKLEKIDDVDENIDKTDIVRNWVWASIPCKICGRKPEEIVAPGQSKFVIAFLNLATGWGIRFFCGEHAQLLQDELVSRGFEILTSEEREKVLDKLDYTFIPPEEG